MGKIRIAALALFLALAFAGAASAGISSTNLNVSATVIPWCSIGVGAVAFGDYEGSQIVVPLNVSVKCTNTTPYAVSMDAGGNYTAGWRHMTDGTNLLTYMLTKPGGGEWSDVGYGGTYPWGSAVGGTGNGSVQGLAGSATLFGNQAPTPGAYTDVVVAAVNF